MFSPAQVRILYRAVHAFYMYTGIGCLYRRRLPTVSTFSCTKDLSWTPPQKLKSYIYMKNKIYSRHSEGIRFRMEGRRSCPEKGEEGEKAVRTSNVSKLPLLLKQTTNQAKFYWSKRCFMGCVRDDETIKLISVDLGHQNPDIHPSSVVRLSCVGPLLGGGSRTHHAGRYENFMGWQMVNFRCHPLRHVVGKAVA